MQVKGQYFIILSYFSRFFKSGEITFPGFRNSYLKATNKRY